MKPVTLVEPAYVEASHSILITAIVISNQQNSPWIILTYRCNVYLINQWFPTSLRGSLIGFLQQNDFLPQNISDDLRVALSNNTKSRIAELIQKIQAQKPQWFKIYPFSFLNSIFLQKYYLLFTHGTNDFLIKVYLD